MSQVGHRLALLGATGAVGAEILRVLEARSLPVAELRAFASARSEGELLELHGAELEVEVLSPGCLAGVDLLWVAAPGVLESLLPDLGDCAIVDLSGVLELDPMVPLYLPGVTLPGRRAAVPRGVATGLALALRPLARECGLARVSATTLESASGAGRRGLEELQQQTLHLLSALDGEVGEGSVFPQPLAFDCLPRVGDFADDDETFEERRLRHVLRRALGRPDLLVELTRVRVPVFMGALAVVHAELHKPLELSQLAELWQAEPALRLLSNRDLPTPRVAAAHDAVQVGRVRLAPGGERLAFVVALDPLRRGAALGAVEAARLLLGE